MIWRTSLQIQSSRENSRSQLQTSIASLRSFRLTQARLRCLRHDRSPDDISGKRARHRIAIRAARALGKTPRDRALISDRLAMQLAAELREQTTHRSKEEPLYDA